MNVDGEGRAQEVVDRQEGGPVLILLELEAQMHATDKLVQHTEVRRSLLRMYMSCSSLITQNRKNALEEYVPTVDWTTAMPHTSKQPRSPGCSRRSRKQRTGYTVRGRGRDQVRLDALKVIGDPIVAGYRVS